MKINLFDENFAHLSCSIHGKIPKHIKYYRNNQLWEGITLFTDGKIFDGSVDKVSSKIKIAWLMEPEAISPANYTRIDSQIHKFDYLITHKEDLLDRYKNKSFKAPTAGVWVNNWVDYSNKNKDSRPISSIYSFKYRTEGHKLRHLIAETIKEVDYFGSGPNNPIETKEEGLSNYMFSIVVENSKTDNYFTEKICDCFATSTIPIYWGPSNIGDFFNTDGIIQFNTVEELSNIVDDININYKKMYEQKKEAIQDNYNRVQEFEITDDWILKNILEELIC